MGDVAAEHTDPSTPETEPEPLRPRFGAGRHHGPAERAARALFEPTEGGGLTQAAVGGQVVQQALSARADPAVAITLSELRGRVALQTGQLERAMGEVETLNHRLQNARARAAAAERAVTRERSLRGRQAAEGARRLGEHERTIAALSADLRRERAAVAAAPDARIAALEMRLAARARLDDRVAQMIAVARRAIADTRAELAARSSQIADLELSLRRERDRRLEAEHRLARADAHEKPRNGERRRFPQPPGPVVGQQAGPADARDPVGARATGAEDVAAACRRLEQELVARHALEVQAARLIGRVNRQLRTPG